MVYRKQVIDEARSWLGTPYQHQGRIKGQNVDCVGLLIKVREVLFGVEDRWPINYSRYPQNWNLKHQFDTELIPIDFTDAKIADVVLISYGVEPSHVGILTDYSEKSFGLIHGHNKQERVVEHRLSNSWISKIVQTYRLPEVVD